MEVEKRLLEKRIEMELIFVDDGSGDGSLKELLKIKELRNETKVIKLTKNFGAVHAYKAGLQFVTGDFFVNSAADLQDPPELILTMVDKWLQGTKYVICKRTSRDDPPMSKLFAYIYYKLSRFFLVNNFPPPAFNLGLLD